MVCTLAVEAELMAEAGGLPIDVWMGTSLGALKGIVQLLAAGLEVDLRPLQIFSFPL